MQAKFQTKMFSAGRARLFGAEKVTLAGAALAGFLLFSGVPRLRAGDDGCRKRVAKADHHLQEALDHHGRESNQVHKARRELSEARE